MPGVSPVSESLGLTPALIAASTQPESVLGAAGWADVAGRSGTLGLEGLALTSGETWDKMPSLWSLIWLLVK